MKITLRKANAVQNNILDAVKSIKVATEVEINEFEDAGKKIAQANATLFEADKRRSDLLMAQFAIRGLVGVANATSGIDAKLTEAAYIDKRMSQLAEISGVKEMTSMEVIEGKLEKLRNRKDDSRSAIYGYNDNVTTSVLTQVQIDEVSNFIKDLRMKKQKLNDEILELNVRTDIELGADVVEVLNKEKLI
jgi:hypothetical protein